MRAQLNDTLVLAAMFRRDDGYCDVDWRHFRNGVEICQLYGAMGEPGSSAALLRYEPGAQVPRHRHTAHEVIVVLSGAQTDDNGRHEAGAILISPPGTEHAIVSDEGCVVLAIYEGPVEFV